MSTRSWNRVELIGNLTRDPELRYTPSGAAVTTFSIATNRSYVSEGERKEEADFHRCVAWNKLAELCNQLLKKGNKVFISGRLQNRSWEAQDGTQRQITEIVVEDMILLTSKNGSNSEGYEDFTEDVTPAKNTSKAVAAEDADTTPEEAPSTKPTEEKPAKEDPGDLDDLPF